MHALSALLLSMAAALAATAAADAKPKYPLRTVSDPSIENGVAVFRQAGAQAKDYWCNAGDFAQRFLGAGAGTSLELIRPEGASGGPSNRPSIGFQLVRGSGDSVTVSVSRVGERHSIAQTRTFCLSQVDPAAR